MPLFRNPGPLVSGAAGTNDSFLLQNQDNPAFADGSFLIKQFNGYEPVGGPSPPDPPPPDPGDTNPGIPNALYRKWEGDARVLTGHTCGDVPGYNPGTITSNGKTYDGAPRHAILLSEECTEMYGFQDTSGGTDGAFKAFPSSMQIQFICPKAGPASKGADIDCGLVTTVCDFKYPGRVQKYVTGGKAIQGFTTDKQGIRFELQMASITRSPDGIGVESILSQFRVYKADTASIGPQGNGRNSGLEVPIPGISINSNGNCMPGLLRIPGLETTYAYRRNFSWVYDRDHIYAPGFVPGGAGAFLIKTGKWYRMIVTRDFTDGDGTLANPYRTWVWLESDTDPRTLILSDLPENGYRGYPHNYRADGLELIDGMLAEWNNSSTYNARDFEVQIRGWFIIRDVFGEDL